MSRLSARAKRSVPCPPSRPPRTSRFSFNPATSRRSSRSLSMNRTPSEAISTTSFGATFLDASLGGAIGPPSKPTRLAQQRLILQLFDHHPCGGPAKDDGNHPPAPRGMVTRPGRHRRAQAVHATARSRTVGQGEARAGRVVAGRRWHLSGQDPQTEEPKDFGNKQLRQEVARRKRFQPLHCPLSTPGFSAPFSASHPPPFARAAARRAARSIARSPRTGRPPPSCAPAPRRRGAAPAVARPGCGWRCRRTRS